jgi:hypothetical protein
VRRDYILHRLLMFVPTLLGASILIFVLLRLVPGDIAEILVYQTGKESSAIHQAQAPLPFAMLVGILSLCLLGGVDIVEAGKKKPKPQAAPRPM